jgi:hypothetical protein
MISWFRRGRPDLASSKARSKTVALWLMPLTIAQDVGWREFSRQSGVPELKFEVARARGRPPSRDMPSGSIGADRMPDRRELYRSPNGNTWFLGREPANGHAFVIHQPNAPSGGRLSHIEVGAFLREGAGLSSKPSCG